jgi:hypothetical protein
MPRLDVHDFIRGSLKGGRNMGKKNSQSIVLQKQEPVTQKLPYTPPKVTFFPLKKEVRVTMCGRNFRGCAIKGVS